MTIHQKRLLAALLVFLGIILFSFSACAAGSGSCGENLTWTLDGAGNRR